MSSLKLTKCHFSGPELVGLDIFQGEVVKNKKGEKCYPLLEGALSNRHVFELMNHNLGRIKRANGGRVPPHPYRFARGGHAVNAANGINGDNAIGWIGPSTQRLLDMHAGRSLNPYDGAPQYFGASDVLSPTNIAAANADGPGSMALKLMAEQAYGNPYTNGQKLPDGVDEPTAAGGDDSLSALMPKVGSISELLDPQSALNRGINFGEGAAKAVGNVLSNVGSSLFGGGTSSIEDAISGGMGAQMLKDPNSSLLGGPGGISIDPLHSQATRDWFLQQPETQKILLQQPNSKLAQALLKDQGIQRWVGLQHAATNAQEGAGVRQFFNAHPQAPGASEFFKDAQAVQSGATATPDPNASVPQSTDQYSQYPSNDMTGQQGMQNQQFQMPVNQTYPEMAGYGPGPSYAQMNTYTPTYSYPQQDYSSMYDFSNQQYPQNVPAYDMSMQMDQMPSYGYQQQGYPYSPY